METTAGTMTPSSFTTELHRVGAAPGSRSFSWSSVCGGVNADSEAAAGGSAGLCQCTQLEGRRLHARFVMVQMIPVRLQTKVMVLKMRNMRPEVLYLGSRSQSLSPCSCSTSFIWNISSVDCGPHHRAIRPDMITDEPYRAICSTAGRDGDDVLAGVI
ncbi:hypothetical protein EYF80_049110 [Liparis tanakae]|uniref:Uncharacterized protein n=1 Tax=Liparis tanakae TaxID=230148 RepID=A0A4Z2FIH0_9TELE|nr:hypothetical protein EYF80_049110 [Liparis tanakae]